MTHILWCGRINLVLTLLQPHTKGSAMSANNPLSKEVLTNPQSKWPLNKILMIILAVAMLQIGWTSYIYVMMTKNFLQSQQENLVLRRQLLEYEATNQEDAQQVFDNNTVYITMPEEVIVGRIPPMDGRDHTVDVSRQNMLPCNLLARLLGPSCTIPPSTARENFFAFLCH